MNLIILICIHTHRCLKELLDCDASITKADKEGNNALHIACIHGQLHIVQFLLQRGLSAELRCVYTLMYSLIITNYIYRCNNNHKLIRISANQFTVSSSIL